jgi:fatty aldehyde decarbonylase
MDGPPHLANRLWLAEAEVRRFWVHGWHEGRSERAALGRCRDFTLPLHCVRDGSRLIQPNRAKNLVDPVPPEDSHCAKSILEENAVELVPCVKPPLATTAPIWQDVLAQAVAGELVAVLNYSSLAGICEDPAEVADALEHAESERGHASAFTAEGAKLGIAVPNNVNAKYWKRLRSAFLRQIEARDFIGCLIIQEVMLESFAVASYQRVGQVAPGSLGSTFAAIAAEEEDHIGHAMSILRAERALNVQRFDDKVHQLHLEVMTTLAEMFAREDADGHCELCCGTCVKPSLPAVGLTTSELRGASLRHYLRTLDMLGLAGEMTLVWATQLPV